MGWEIAKPLGTIFHSQICEIWYLNNSDSLEFFKLKIKIGNLNIYPGYVELFGASWFHLTLPTLSLTFVELKFTKTFWDGGRMFSQRCT